jgi:hypothetical protein
MDNHSEPDGKRLADQPAYSRFYWCDLCQKSSFWTCIRQEQSNTTLVQAPCGHYRLYADESDFLVAS